MLKKRIIIKYRVLRLGAVRVIAYVYCKMLCVF